jgi:HK97 family phage portal protein
MRLLGFDLSRLARVVGAKALPRNLSGVGAGRGGWTTIFDTVPGGWQRHVEPLSTDVLLTQSTVFACITLIAGDIGKLRLRLVERTADGITREVPGTPARYAALRRPNHYQTAQQFLEAWSVSKLTDGNAYVLKSRAPDGSIAALYPLDPRRVRPLVAEDGSVYYALNDDTLSGIAESSVTMPASEVIHDRWNCLHHPLVGLSPITACALAASTAVRISENAASFFANMSRPSGMLTAPARISDETAERIKRDWQQNYSAGNIGRLAVLGDGLKYEPMTMTATDAQLVEQLRLSAEQVCSVFHVPAYMVGAGAPPAYNNIEALGQQYYAQCLQVLIEAIENSLDIGLGLGESGASAMLHAQFDLDGLLRTDTATLTSALRDQVGAGITAPNEARRRLNLPPATGGETPYLQQQNYSLAALAARDESGDAFGTGTARQEAAQGAQQTEEARAANDERIATTFADAVRGMQTSVEAQAQAAREATEQIARSIEAMLAVAQQRDDEAQHQQRAALVTRRIVNGLDGLD